MGIDKIFQALNEYVKLKKSHDSGEQYNFPLVQVKREVEAALIELIDSRIKAYHSRERRRSQTTMQSQQEPKRVIGNTPSTAPTIQQPAMIITDMSNHDTAMLDALNSAPTPPGIPAQWLTSGKPLDWIEAYINWYYGKRNVALNKVK